KLIFIYATKAFSGNLELSLRQLTVGPALAPGFLAQLFPHMRQCRNQEPTGSACRVNNLFGWLGVNDPYHHLHNVPWCEELAFGAAQGWADENFEGIADSIAIGLHDAVVL